MLGLVLRRAVPRLLEEVRRVQHPRDALALAHRSARGARTVLREAHAIAFEMRGVIARRYGVEAVEPQELAPEVRVHEVVNRPSYRQIEEWIAESQAAEADSDNGAVNRACEAALRLSELPELPEIGLRVLEKSVLEYGRSARVQMAAIDALGWSGGDAAERALLRMQSVIRRRLAWEPGPADAMLLQHIEARIRFLNQRLGAGLPSAA